MADDRGEHFRRVKRIFSDAAFIASLGVKLEAAGEGWCETSLLAADLHLQQHGYIHAGVVTTLADHTAGGAARSALGDSFDVITIEFKINFLAPATGNRLTCRGKTLRSGKHIVVAESEVYCADGARRKLVAKLVSTLMVIPQAVAQG